MAPAHAHIFPHYVPSHHFSHWLCWQSLCFWNWAGVVAVASLAKAGETITGVREYDLWKQRERPINRDGDTLATRRFDHCQAAIFVMFCSPPTLHYNIQVDDRRSARDGDERSTKRWRNASGADRRRGPSCTRFCKTATYSSTGRSSWKKVRVSLFYCHYSPPPLSDVAAGPSNSQFRTFRAYNGVRKWHCALAPYQHYSWLCFSNSVLDIHSLQVRMMCPN